jgi:Zn-dependent protease
MLGLSAPQLISRIIILMVAFTIHELAHAWSADEMGDNTPRRMGRLTLNPLAHLDPLGSIMLLFIGFGWAKPVPVNPYALRYGPQMGMAIVAAAGPFSNLIMALLAAVPFRLGVLSPFGAQSTGLLPTPSGFLIEFMFINLLLMLFNLIPIAPLDGSKILRGFAPREWDGVLLNLERWGPFMLMGLVFLGRGVLGAIIFGPAQFLMQLMILGP